MIKIINIFKKILTVKCLVQEEFNIDDKVKVSEYYKEEVSKLVKDFEELLQRDGRPLTLAGSAKEVSDHIAGNAAFKFLKFIYCPECHFVSENLSTCEHNTYSNVLSRCELTFPSVQLSECIAQNFAFLDASSNLIRLSSMPETSC